MTDADSICQPAGPKTAVGSGIMCGILLGCFEGEQMELEVIMLNTYSKRLQWDRDGSSYAEIHGRIK